MKLGRLSSRMPVLKARHIPESQGHRSRERRTTGRKLQERRLKLWNASPECAMCGRFTMFPDGFELDHIVPLFKGGEDVESNCQILCNGVDGCHEKKTKQDQAGLR